MMNAPPPIDAIYLSTLSSNSPQFSREYSEISSMMGVISPVVDRVGTLASKVVSLKASVSLPVMFHVVVLGVLLVGESVVRMQYTPIVVHM